jgi:magnesium chelatase family protein
MVSKVFSSSIHGIDGIRVEVEVDIAHGLPSFAIVGLPEPSVKESRERVRAAIKNAGFDFPNDRITINLAPADVRKEGSSFDLPIALGMLTAMGAIRPEALGNHLITGELSLDGRIKGIRGVLPMALLAAKEGFGRIIVPSENGREASVVKGIDVLGAPHLLDIVHYLKGDGELSQFRPEEETETRGVKDEGLDFADIKGQEQAKRALEIAAAGAHNMLMIGPPGSGKTMLARRIPTILPPLNYPEALETTKIHSIAGFLNEERFLVSERPFRAPHHTISDAGLIGGGSFPRPGEISLAHNGVLFLDEFPEFKRNILDSLRQPLESGNVVISRAAQAVTFPARFMLIAAMNPCPCGYYSDSRRPCICSGAQIHRYRTKVSGPLLDRIDIQIGVPPVTMRELSLDTEEESSTIIRKRVIAGRAIQAERFAGKTFYANGQMAARLVKKYCAVDVAARNLLEHAVERFGLSARAYHRILKVSRTIADLDGKTDIDESHVAEAVQYRALDKKLSL